MTRSEMLDWGLRHGQPLTAGGSSLCVDPLGVYAFDDIPLDRALLAILVMKDRGARIYLSPKAWKEVGRGSNDPVAA